MELDGEKGLLRASSLRLWPICMIAVRVCRLGLCTVGLMSALAGRWVSLLGVRRKLYCAMKLIFEPLGLGDNFRLLQEIVTELMSLVVLGTLAVVNLRASFANVVVAADASEDWIAGVAAECPSRCVEEFSRHTLCWTQLLQPFDARLRGHGHLDPEFELPGESFRTHALWTTLATSLQHKFVWREKVRRRTHIKVLEVRAHLRHERRLANTMCSKRILYLGPSLTI